jgi:integrase
MLEAGESPGWVAKQLGHTNAEMVYRRYHKFIPNLRGRDGAPHGALARRGGAVTLAVVAPWLL